MGIPLTQKTEYNISTDVQFKPLELIDVNALVGACKDKWHNQTLTQVNDCVVRLGILEGEFHWHKHDNEDEFFYVVDGELTIELDGRTVKLGPQQGLNVPRGVMHKTSAPERTVVLMIEAATVVPTGD
jgi:mannose-6-phosphate isomerase-like protein (cupin superfamily)